MRLLPLSLLLILPLLAACDSSTPKAPAANAPAAAVTPAKAPAAGKTPAATAKLPPGARPLIGSWAAADCSDAKGLTVVSATSYAAGGKSCDIALADNKDGTFSATCNNQDLKLTPIFGPTGEGIRIAAGDKSSTVFRCSK